MKNLILGAALAAALSCAGLPARAQNTAGIEFLKEAMQGNLAEVELGKLARQKGASEGVRSFGSRLEQDHSQANKKAAAVAKSLKLEPPTEPSKQQKDNYQLLSRLSGADFDRAFAKHMVDDHKRDIADYEREAKGSNPAVAKYASETLPTLRKHLELAQSLAGSGTTGSR
jgi:putative membrane protein